MGPPVKGRRGIDNSAFAGRLIVSVTVVALAPAGMEAGENVAVAPDGIPVIARLIAAGNVWPLGGAKTSVYVACPPGCAVAFNDAPVGGAIVKVSTTSGIVELVMLVKLLSPE